ncbi:MAG TPA: hypothetical protein VG225_15900 [Terracidiphilus sp.]|jgi:hypothetical protein|nr:hypothetical protein [Terracidiphilus sp.]
MTRSVLLGYQWVTGLSDTATGALLCVAPAFTLRLMGLHAPADARPYVSYIGAFVLSVGIACLYGALLVAQRAGVERLEAVWLLTAFSRSAVAIYVLKAIVSGSLEPAWVTVATFDAVCVAIQAIGLRQGWLPHAL